MSGERVAGKVIFETQSTHKMLAALSQASLIHIKGEYDEEAFNEAFMMHTTTSPSYPIVASVETAAAMLRGNPGKRLINRSVERALHFRKEVQRLREESDGWFFDIWQPPQVDEAECWPVAPGEQWHGFSDADANHMFLDPVKVTILTPGMDEHGNMSEEDPGGAGGKIPRRTWDRSRKPALITCCFSLVLASIKPKQWDYCVG